MYNEICTYKASYQQALELANDKMADKYGEIVNWTPELSREFTDLVADIMNSYIIGI